MIDSQFPADEIQILDRISSQELSISSKDVALRRPLVELVDASVLASARQSDNTARAYQTAIGLFISFLDMQRGDLLPVELTHWRPFAQKARDGKRTQWIYRCPAIVLRLVDSSILDGFAAWRASEGDSVNSVSTRLYAVRTFLSVAYRDNILTYEQAVAMRLQPYRARQKRDIRPVGRRLSASEVRALRETVNTRTLKGKRDIAILDSMLYLGLRRDEVVHLRVGNLRQDGDRWWVVLTGKGGKTRRLKVHETLRESLFHWMQSPGLNWVDERTHLFYSVNKGDHLGRMPINASVVGRLVAEYGWRAGLAPRHGENQLSAHDLRRTCARIAFDNSKNLLLVQAMLGHSDPKTTARYIGAYDDDNNTAIDYIQY